MQLQLTDEESLFLKRHLARHIEQVESELAHTDKHELQHALAHDVSKLRTIAERLERANH